MVNSESLSNGILMEKVRSYIQEKIKVFSNKIQELKITLKEKWDTFLFMRWLVILILLKRI